MQRGGDAAAAMLGQDAHVDLADRRDRVVDHPRVGADAGRHAVERREQVAVTRLPLASMEEEVELERVVQIDPVPDVAPLREPLDRELLDLDHGSGPWKVRTRSRSM